MKIQLFSSCINSVLLLLFFQSCGNTSNSVAQKQDTSRILSQQIYDSVQGFWTSLGIEPGPGCNNRIDEISNEPVGDIQNWLILGDRIDIFRYPCQYYGASRFTIKKDSIYAEGYITALWHVKFESGVMILTDKKCHVRSFFRDTSSVGLIDKLRNDSINFRQLVGRYKVVNSSSIKGDGEKIITTLFCKVPDEIVIVDSFMADSVYHGKPLKLKTNVGHQLFYLDSLNWDNYNGSYVNTVNNNGKITPVITLRPGDWWKGEDFTVSYVRE